MFVKDQKKTIELILIIFADKPQAFVTVVESFLESCDKYSATRG